MMDVDGFKNYVLRQLSGGYRRLHISIETGQHILCVISDLERQLKQYKNWLAEKNTERDEIVDQLADATAELAELRAYKEAAEKKQEPLGYVYSDDMEKLETTECARTIYSVEVGAPDKGECLPVYRYPVSATRPAPCEHLCEAKAYEIEIRQLKKHLEMTNKPSALKENQIAELINTVRDVAIEFAGTQQLRERIAGILRPVLCTAIPSHSQQSARPTDDELWDQTITERDTYHDWADKLADAIARYFGSDIGEHTSANNPWAEALEVIERSETRELNDDTRFILGRPNFWCHAIAIRMRELGHDIPHKAEDEQAPTINLMLEYYDRFGDEWRSKLEGYLRSTDQDACPSHESEQHSFGESEFIPVDLLLKPDLTDEDVEKWRKQNNEAKVAALDEAITMLRRKPLPADPFIKSGFSEAIAAVVTMRNSMNKEGVQREY